MTDHQWVEPTAAQRAAADEYIQILLRECRTQAGVHAGTAIASAARMAGTFLLRSFSLPLKDVAPGTPVLSEQANDHGPLLMRTLGTELIGLVAGLDQNRLSEPVPDNVAPLL